MSKRQKHKSNPRQASAFQLLGRQIVMNNCSCPECSAKHTAHRLAEAITALNDALPSGPASNHVRAARPTSEGRCQYCSRIRLNKNKPVKQLRPTIKMEPMLEPPCRCAFCATCSRLLTANRANSQQSSGCKICGLCTVHGEREMGRDGIIRRRRMCCQCDRCLSCKRLINKSNSICAQCGFCIACCRHGSCNGCGRDRISTRSLSLCLACAYCADCECRCANLRTQHIGHVAKARQIAMAYLDAQRKRMAALIPSVIDTISLGPARKVFTNADGVTFFSPAARERCCHHSNRYAAAEIEVAGVNPNASASLHTQLKAIVKDWRGGIVEDISLPDGGFEINCSPAAGDLLRRQIHEIIGALNALGATVINYTDTAKWLLPCGAHVHIDARDHTYYDLRRFLLIYGTVESALYQLIAPYRQYSHYCVPCGNNYLRAALSAKPGRAVPYETRGVKNSLIDIAYGRGRIPNIKDKRSCPTDTRYRALNIHAWWLRGTLEFRHFHGTMDAQELSGWAELLANLVDAAYRMPDAKAIDLGCQFARDGSAIKSMQLLYQLLPEPSQIFIAAQQQHISLMGPCAHEVSRLGHFPEEVVALRIANLTGRPLSEIEAERKILRASSQVGPYLGIPQIPTINWAELEMARMRRMRVSIPSLRNTSSTF